MKATKMAVLSVIFFLVSFSLMNCAGYTRAEYKRNLRNLEGKKLGYEIDPNARYSERDSLRRMISMKRIISLPVHGDTLYKGFIFNESKSQAVSWAIYDEDGVKMGSGRLPSVWSERRRTRKYKEYVVDSLSIPFGDYQIVYAYKGGKYPYSFHVPSPKDSPYGKQGHWHTYIR